MADTSDQQPDQQPDQEAEGSPDRRLGTSPDLDPAAAPTPPPRRNGRPQRISRWDRPPEPHDWRWVVGHIGRAMITAGLLMFGFVAYQLWGTGIQTARAQNALDREFNEFFEQNGITPGTLAPGTSTTTATTGSTTPASSPVTTETASTDEAADVTTLPPTTAATVAQDYGDIDPGDPLAKLVIPAINLDWNVVAGVTVQDLAKGPGHFPDTPLPGQLGNAAIAGHRTGHGGPFIDLDKLRPGDEIQVFTQLGDAYAYIVNDSVIVAPSAYQVITDSDPAVATLTLVTCTPKYESTNRLVVHATLDTSRSSPVGLPSIFYGQAEPIPVEPVLPADDTAVTSPATSEATSPETSEATSAATSAATAVPAPAAPTTTPSSTTADAAAVPQSNEFADEDAFSQGWFDDGRALPHVAGWAALLALVAYGAYRFANRFRRLYLAFVVGCVPFAVALYFFYENVNRLLPAAI